MDSFVFRNLDSEKPMKSHHHRFPRITDVFRYMEICVVLLVLLWFSTKLPLNPTFFLQSLQDICGFLRSPRFVFVVGNAIVLTLFLKSGQFSAEDSTDTSSCGGGGDVYDEFVKNSVISKKIRHEPTKPTAYINQETPIPNSATQETPLPESTTPPPPPPATPALDNQILTKTNADGIKKSHKYQRSRSEYMKREKAPPAARRELRRSKTEKSKEEMSNEEFQQTIEEFIARQVKFIREESMAMVVKK